MAPILNTQSTAAGLPLCLSGITHPVALSKEMADHDRRRKGFKKTGLRIGEILHAVAVADQEYNFGANLQRVRLDLQEEGVSEEIRGEAAGDLAAVAILLQQLSCICLSSSCTAKAA